MKTADIRLRTIQFVARFGFITRDLFFEYFSSKSRSQKYLFWKMLIEGRWLIPHSSNQSTAYLSNRARNEFAPQAVPARSKFFLEHDSLAARFFLELEKLGLVDRFWTERELSINQWETYSILGCDDLDKIPDLVVDLKASYGTLRVAIEIERTQKAKSRYDQAALSYLGMKNIDLVIYGCRYKETVQQIEMAFNGEIFKVAHKAPAVYLTGEFIAQRMNADIKYQDRHFKLLEFLGLAMKLKLKSGALEKSENPGQSSGKKANSYLRAA